MKNNNVNIFFSCDDNYIPFLAVSLCSLKENANKKFNYKIHVLHANSISKENQEKIKCEFNGKKFEVLFDDIVEKVESFSEKLHTRDYYSKSTYYRLFIPALYPNLDKALYLDSDICILGDISKLFNTNLGDNFVGAVTDQAVMNVKEFINYVKNRIGVNTEKEYFNAGILLMNLKKLREINFEEVFFKLLQNVTFNVAQDQDYLNAICKNNVTYIDASWNVMPIKNNLEKINLIHYNLSYKPWHADNILYEDIFWNYAKKTSYFNKILEIKNNYSIEDIEKCNKQTVNLIKLAQNQADEKDENIKINKFISSLFTKNIKFLDSNIKQSPERIKILKKIEELEKQGKFDIDAENDPDGRMLQPGEVDYLQKKFSTKIKSKYAYFLARKFMNNLLKNKKLIIKDIVGIENWKKLNTGAIITCNHFNPFDSFAMQIAYEKSGQKKKMYKVIREGNYTGFKGLYGKIFRNCNTLPLSSNPKVMMEFLKAINTHLQNGNFVLVYPEQSLWWNYKKPKPLKEGAFKFAVKNNVPVLPIFITLSDSDIVGEDGFFVQEYTINVLKPIYPNKTLTLKEQIEELKDKNEEMWKDCYEKFYNKKLVYTCSNLSDSSMKG